MLHTIITSAGSRAGSNQSAFLNFSPANEVTESESRDIII